MKWAVLVGGTGSNLQAILQAGIPIDVVLSHKANVRALDVAREFGVPALVLLPKDFASRAEYDVALCRELDNFGVGAVAMAGFLRWLQPTTIRHFEGRIINVHPSLLPSFPGLNAIAQAYQHPVKITGVTVHFVDDGQDTGPIIAQSAVPIWPSDTLDDLTGRIHRTEHRLYPKVIQAMQEDRVALENNRVVWKGGGDQWASGH